MESTQTAMQIGEVAARTELSLRSLRHWEEVGLLQPVGPQRRRLPALHRGRRREDPRHPPDEAAGVHPGRDEGRDAPTSRPSPSRRPTPRAEDAARQRLPRHPQKRPNAARAGPAAGDGRRVHRPHQRSSPLRPPIDATLPLTRAARHVAQRSSSASIRSEARRASRSGVELSLRRCVMTLNSLYWFAVGFISVCALVVIVYASEMNMTFRRSLLALCSRSFWSPPGRFISTPSAMKLASIQTETARRRHMFCD